MSHRTPCRYGASHLRLCRLRLLLLFRYPMCALLSRHFRILYRCAYDFLPYSSPMNRKYDYWFWLWLRSLSHRTPCRYGASHLRLCRLRLLLLFRYPMCALLSRHFRILYRCAYDFLPYSSPMNRKYDYWFWLWLRSLSRRKRYKCTSLFLLLYAWVLRLLFRHPMCALHTVYRRIHTNAYAACHRALSIHRSCVL